MFTQEIAAKIIKATSEKEGEEGKLGCHITVAYWNLTSLVKWDTIEATNKQSIIQEHLGEGVVCIAETQWRPEDAGTAAQRFPMTQIVSHPKDPVAQPNTNGGVAMIIPKYLGYHGELIPLPHTLKHYKQFLVTVKVTKANRSYIVHVVYFPPNRVAELWETFSEWFSETRDHPQIIIGDVNPGRKHDIFPGLECILQDCYSEIPIANGNITFRQNVNDVGAVLDRCFIRDVRYDMGCMAYQLHAAEWAQGRNGHRIIQLKGMPQLNAGPTRHKTYTAIPTSALEGEGRHIMELRRRLFRAEFEREGSAFERVRRLKSIGWAWWDATPRQFKKNLRGQYDDIKCAAARGSETVWVDIKQLRALELLVGSHPQLAGLELNHANSVIRVDTVDLKRLLHLYDEHNEVKRAQAESYIGEYGHTEINAKAAYRKIRKLHPKTLKGPTALVINGKPTTSSEDIQDAYLDNRIDVWCHPAPTSLSNQLLLIHKYIKAIGSRDCQVPRPAKEEVVEHIMNTTDSAPGLDGIPYAFYRLCPEMTADIILSTITEVATWDPMHYDAMPHSYQMLVWIPKKEDALSPDEMRPLALPTTFHRMLFGVIAKLADKHLTRFMNQAQALVSDRRDAQANFESIQHYLQTGQVILTERKGKVARVGDDPESKGGRSELRTVLQVDLNKAFERVSSQWILLALSAFGIPHWLFMVIQFFLTGRRSQFKIGRHLMAVIIMLCGLDMGNGLSPFTFCISVDPLLELLENVQNVEIVKAYMDDLQIGTNSMKARKVSQHLIKLFASASGLVVTSHTCFRARLIRILLDPKSKFGIRAIKRDVYGASKYSVQKVIRNNKWARKHGKARTGRHFFTTSPEGLHEGPPKCGCKTKAQILVNRTLRYEEGKTMEKMPLGTAPLATQTTMLGMILKGAPPYRGWKKAEGKGASVKKGHLKADRRGGKGVRMGMPVQTAALHWNAYCQSCLQYGASLEGINHRQRDDLLRLRSKALGIKGWMPAREASGIFAALGLPPLADPTIEAGGAVIGAALRLHGTNWMAGNATSSMRVKHATRIIAEWIRSCPPGKEMIQWRKSLVDASFALLSQISAIILPKLKNIAKAGQRREGQAWLIRKSRARDYLRSNGEEWSKVGILSKKELGAQPRMAYARLFAGGDMNKDFGYRKSNTAHETTCMYCTGSAKHSPFGRSYKGLCEQHFEEDYSMFQKVKGEGMSQLLLQLFQKGALEERSHGTPTEPPDANSANGREPVGTVTNPANPSTFIREMKGLVLQNNGEGQDSSSRCCLCGLLGSGNEHMVHWCPITYVCKGLVTGSYRSREWILEGDPDNHGAIIMLAFQARQLERARSALGVETTENRWVQTIRQIMEAWWASLPAQIRPNAMSDRLRHFCGTNYLRSEKKESGCPGCIPHVKIRGARRPYRTRVRNLRMKPNRKYPTVSVPIGCGQLVGVVPAYHTRATNGSDVVEINDGVIRKYGTGRPPPIREGPHPNVKFSPQVCGCGRTLARITATKQIWPGQEIIVQKSEAKINLGARLLLQGDGGYTRSHGAKNNECGAGVAVWHLSHGVEDRHLFSIIIPAPGLDSSMQAEGLAVIGILNAIPAALEYCRTRNLPVTGALIAHLDNHTWAGFSKGNKRIKHRKLIRMSIEVKRLMTQISRKIEWTHRPRECNWAADAAATEAKKVVKQFNLLNYDMEAGVGIRVTRNEVEERPREQLGLSADMEPGRLDAGMSTWHKERLWEEISRKPKPKTGQTDDGDLTSQDCVIIGFEEPVLVSGIGLALRHLEAQATVKVRTYCELVMSRQVRGLNGIGVMYQTKDAHQQGRAYPITPGAAALPRKIGVLLFGTTHMEYDIIGCHPAIFGEIANLLYWKEFPWWHDVHALRNFMAQETRLAQHGSQLSRILLMGNAEDVYKYVLDHQGIVSGQLLSFIAKFPEIKNAVRRQLWARGFIGNRDRHNERNVLYFALEAAEAAVIWEWRMGLYKAFGLISCVVKGDALWLPASLPKHIVIEIFEQACAMHGFAKLQLRCTDLLKEAADKIKILEETEDRHEYSGRRKRMREDTSPAKLRSSETAPNSHDETCDLPKVVEPQRKAPKTILEMLGAWKEP